MGETQVIAKLADLFVIPNGEHRKWFIVPRITQNEERLISLGLH